MANLLLQWILHRPGDENGYMWCPYARLDTENELPRAKPIPLEQYFQLAESCRRRAPTQYGWNDQNGQKTTKMTSKSNFFLTFSNGPKWIKVASKWSKMAPKRIFGPFGPVFVSFGSVPPSIWGVPPSGWGHPALPGIRLGGTPLEPTFASCGHRQGPAPGSWLPEWPNCCSNVFYIVWEMKTGICGAHTLA